LDAHVISNFYVRNRGTDFLDHATELMPEGDGYLFARERMWMCRTKVGTAEILVEI
jgi:hypothetical protein